MTLSDQLEELRNLPPNWDSYGASPITMAVAAQVQEFLGSAQLVPTVSGGVQVEWHREGLHLEVEFAPDGTVDGVWVEHNGYEIGTDENPPHVAETTP